MMEKNITLKMWLSVLFGGIWQFVCKIFSWKTKTPFWRIICSALTVCVIIITCAIIYEVHREYIRDCRWIQNEAISSKMNFSRHEYRKGSGWISRKTTGEIITTDVDGVCVSDDGDSLAVFSSKGKHGYINRYSGEISIAPQFDMAWTFSSGVAAVVKDNKVYFIDHSGTPINEKTFVYKPRNDYIYYGDYCVMNDDHDKLGLIDRKGEWIIEPEYEWIGSAPRNYWKMLKGDSETGLWYAFTDKIVPVNETGATGLDICEDLGVIYTLPNHLKMVVDFEGNRTEKFLCRDIEAMYYETEQRDSANSFIPARCTLYRYRMDDGYEGLCRENGDIVTDPLYWNIQPIGKDLYHCTYKNSGVGVIINTAGEISG